MSGIPLADNHVHTHGSWDASRGDMEATCRRAVELGLRSVAFTEHADWIRGDDAVFDADDYFECLERCRAAYPELRILSGVEMGEPHWHEERAKRLLSRGFDRVLGSVHCIEWEGTATDASHPRLPDFGARGRHVPPLSEGGAGVDRGKRAVRGAGASGLSEALLA